MHTSWLRKYMYNKILTHIHIESNTGNVFFKFTLYVSLSLHIIIS